MVKEVIFDCFGVLTEDGWLAFLRKFDDGGHTEELRYINHQFDNGNLPYQDFLSEACRLTGADRATADELITKSHHINVELLDYAAELKGRGFLLGVISNVGSNLESFLPDVDLTIFDNVTLSYEVGAIKPDPLIFEAHLEKTGHNPEEAVFIDDREVNVDGAAMVGLLTVLYEDFEQMKQSVEKLIN